MTENNKRKSLLDLPRAFLAIVASLASIAACYLALATIALSLRPEMVPIIVPFLPTLEREIIPVTVIVEITQPAIGEDPPQQVTSEVTREVTREVTVEVTGLPLAATQTAEPSLLFNDDFDEGLSELWEVLSGNPIVANKVLTADQATWLSIGDETWADYSVEFTADSSTCTLTPTNSNLIAVRVNDLGNAIMFGWTNCFTAWYVVEGGDYGEVPGTRASSGVSDMVKVRLIVKGDLMTATVGGVDVSSFFNTRFETGGVSLRLKASSSVDSFSVRAID